MREDIGVLFVGSLLLHKFLLATVDKGRQINVPQHIYSADSSFFVIGKRVLKSFFINFTMFKIFGKSLVEPYRRTSCRDLQGEVVAQFVIDDAQTLLVFFFSALYDGLL